MGIVNGVFGVQGWIKIFSETQPRENIVKYPHWYLQRSGTQALPKPGVAADGWQQNDWQQNGGRQNGWQKVELVGGRLQGKNVIAKIKGVETRQQAEALRGYNISIDQHSLPDLGDDEFYWRDLVGLAVYDLADRELGTIDRIFETGANDVMVVKSEDGAEILVPWVKSTVVIDVDISAKRMKVDWDPDY